MYTLWVSYPMALPTCPIAVRYLLALFLVVAARQPNQAQPLLDTLASKVCRCMANEPEIIYPRLQAARCVNEVASRYAPQIRRGLSLTMALPEERRRLTELLIDPLTSGCPMLQGLTTDKREPELNYSDFPLFRARTPMRFQKHPPPDPPATTLREGEDMLRVNGTVAAVNAGNLLELRLESGKTLSFLLRARHLRRTHFSVGQPLRVTYTYDWQSDAKRAVPVALTIE